MSNCIGLFRAYDHSVTYSSWWQCEKFMATSMVLHQFQTVLGAIRIVLLLSVNRAWGCSPRVLALLLLHRFSRVWLCATPQMAGQGSPVPGILQARTLESVAISFSNACKWKGKVKSLNRVWLIATPWTAAYQASLPMGFSRQKYWSGVPLPSPPRVLQPVN